MQLDAPTQTNPSPMPSWVWQPMSEGANHSGRTLKRVRDNRPDERLIHGEYYHFIRESNAQG